MKRTLSLILSLLMILSLFAIVPIDAAEADVAETGVRSNDGKYDLWVGSTQVTDENKDDILHDGGKAKFNPLTSYLTLNEPVIPDVYHNSYYGDYLIGFEDTMDLTINGSYHMTSPVAAKVGLIPSVGDCGKLTLAGDFSFLLKNHDGLFEGLFADDIDIERGSLYVETDGCRNAVTAYRDYLMIRSAITRVEFLAKGHDEASAMSGNGNTFLGIDQSLDVSTPENYETGPFLKIYEILESGEKVQANHVVIERKRPVVSFNANGGSGEMDNVKVSKGSSYKLPKCTFTAPTNKQFKNWKIGSSYYNPGDTITVNSDTTAYAQWEDAKYTVSFNSNGGSGSMNSAQVKVGNTYKLPQCTFTPPSGKTFKNWQVGNTYYNPNDTIIVSGDTTVYAQWMDTIIPTASVTVNAPEAGAHPSFQTTPGDSEKYNTTFSYSKSGWFVSGTDEELSSTNVFAAGKSYDAVVTFKTWAPFSFDSNVTCKINGKTATIIARPDQRTVTAKVTFTVSSANAVTNVTATGIIPPAVDQVLSRYVDEPDSSARYTLSNTKWYDMTDNISMTTGSKFKAGHIYRAALNVEVKSGYTFADEVNATINGQPASEVVHVSGYETTKLVIRYIFPALGGGAKIGGSLKCFGSASDSTQIQLIKGGAEMYSITATGNNTSYLFDNVATGYYYTLRVSKKNHVTRDYSIYVSGDMTQDVKICPIGDVDNNGKVNAADAKAAFQHGNEQKLITDDYKIKCADVTSPKNRVNSADAKAIFQHANEQKSLWTE